MCLRRMLLLRLTDGRVTVKALEFKPCQTLDHSQLPPGTKVRVSGAAVKAGVVLLEDKNIKVRNLNDATFMIKANHRC